MTNLIKKQFAAPTDAGAFQPGALVMYENDGEPLLAVILAARKMKFALLNERAREVELPENRLTLLPGRAPSDLDSNAAKAGWLSNLRSSAEANRASLNLEELWNVVQSDSKEYSMRELCELYFSDNSLEHNLLTRLVLIFDRVFFRRNKDSFAPRSMETVEQLKKAELNRQEKARAFQVTISALAARLKNSTVPLPPESQYTIRLLEEIAAGCELDHLKQKEAKALLEELAQSLRLELFGNKEQQAYFILERIGHFNQRTNLALIRHHVPVSYSAAALEAASALAVPTSLDAFPTASSQLRQDLTHLHVFTIDDVSTDDMDDALSLEHTASGYRLGVHVSDVASAIAPDSALDLAGRQRATSIYLPEQIVHMLPPEVSCSKLSLIAGETRPVLSCFFDFNRSFELLSTEIMPALVRVQKRCNYDEVDKLLLSEQAGDLGIIYNLTITNETERLHGGAMKVYKRDLIVKIMADGEVQLIEYDEHGPARGLVGETMVMANALLANYAKTHKLAVAFRGQEAPEDQELNTDIQDGPAHNYAQRARLKKSSVSLSPTPHSGLGLSAYIQATSPIRRYIDLCNQRQIVQHLLTGKPFYTHEQFEKILQETEQPLFDAGQTSKETKRFWLLRYLQQRGERLRKAGQRENTIEGTVLRTDLRNPLIEVEEVFFNVVAKASHPVKPGDRVQLRLSAVDPLTDYLKVDML